MSVKQLALLSYYLHLKHVSETALLSYWVTTYTSNMSVKQLALLSYYLHLKHVSETAGLTELLLTP